MIAALLGTAGTPLLLRRGLPSHPQCRHWRDTDLTYQYSHGAAMGSQTLDRRIGIKGNVFRAHVISDVGRPIALLWAIMTPPFQAYEGSRSCRKAHSR